MELREKEEEGGRRGRMEPGGVGERFRVQASQQDILFELPNTISSNKKGETFEIISHRRDTETLIVTLARGQG